MIVRNVISIRVALAYSWKKLLVVLLNASAVSAAYWVFGRTDLAIPFVPVTVLGTALAILIAFRNNAAYDRWWEARKQWGSLINESRSFGRQVIAFLGAAAETLALRRELVYR